MGRRTFVHNLSNINFPSNLVTITWWSRNQTAMTSAQMRAERCQVPTVKGLQERLRESTVKASKCLGLFGVLAPRRVA